jgi:hypothetical protein
MYLVALKDTVFDIQNDAWKCVKTLKIWRQEKNIKCILLVVWNINKENYNGERSSTKLWTNCQNCLICGQR